MGIEDPDYQVGARFEALDEGVLAAASNSTGYFFVISIFLEVRCLGFDSVLLHLLLPQMQALQSQ